MSLILSQGTMISERPSTILLWTVGAMMIALLVSKRFVREDRWRTTEPDVEPLLPSEDWRRLGEPLPSDWLSMFDEPGQTFAEYKRQVRNRKSDTRSKIYVVPLGDIAEKQAELLERSTEYFSIFFDCETELLPPESLPGAAYNAERRQYDADVIIDEVMGPLAREREDALATIGLVGENLYHGNLNFVIGLGSHAQRAGVYSVHKFYQWTPGKRDRDQAALIRTLKTGSHEIGHTLGLMHCTFYECVMNGSNSLPESDRRPLFLCPVCLRKAEWNLKFDRPARYKRLKAFFEDCGLDDEAAFCERRITEVEQLGREQQHTGE